ncbi:hypothetical protein HYU21_02880 [Candidatus Woesearchaeota archaeon]|nr:hypothetical protein [Candidatus Woesearchaeota archaeon]
MNFTPKDIKSEKVLVVRRDSIVSSLTLADRVIISKSYQPETYPEYKEIFGTRTSSSDAYPIDYIKSYGLEYQRSLYTREKAVISALSSLDRCLVPKYLKSDDKKMKIYMEFIPYPTFQEEFLNAKGDRGKTQSLTKELTDIITEFHLVCNNNLSYLISHAKFGKKRKLYERNEKEEKKRWTNYFLSIIYHGSEDFNQYREEKGLNEEGLTPQKIRKYIKLFLHEKKKINLEDLVDDFIQTDMAINNSKNNFISGDFGPQNVFRIEDEPRQIRVFDFDKARLGNQDIDLTSAIYNIHRNNFDKEEEIFSVSCAAEYYRKLGVAEKDLPERLAKLCVESRLKQNIRLFSVYCKMIPYEIRKYLGEKEEYPELKNGELRAAFLNEMFSNNFKKFFDYFRQGEEGWHLLIDPISVDTMVKIKHQLFTIESFLKDCNVLPLGSINQDRLKRFKKIITPSN